VDSQKGGILFVLLHGRFGFGKVDVGGQVFKGYVRLYAPFAVKYGVSQFEKAEAAAALPAHGFIISHNSLVIFSFGDCRFLALRWFASAVIGLYNLFFVPRFNSREIADLSF
jgi:hypothetical protein